MVHPTKAEAMKARTTAYIITTAAEIYATRSREAAEAKAAELKQSGIPAEIHSISI